MARHLGLCTCIALAGRLSQHKTRRLQVKANLGFQCFEVWTPKEILIDFATKCVTDQSLFIFVDLLTYSLISDDLKTIRHSNKSTSTE